MCYCVQIKNDLGHTTPIAEPFIVPTPMPYVVSLAFFGSAERKAEMVQELLSGCEVLYQVLALLGISFTTARERGFSLNKATGLELRDIALSQANYAALSLIDGRTW